MPKGTIERRKVERFLKSELGFSFDRHGKRSRIWRLPGSVPPKIVVLKRSNTMSEVTARVALQQAGATPEQIEAFMQAVRC